MAERLFGTNQHYADTGNFTEQYFYKLRGCVAPKTKSKGDMHIQTPISQPGKSRQQLAMDKARTKVNQRKRSGR